MKKVWLVFALSCAPIFCAQASVADSSDVVEVGPYTITVEQYTALKSVLVLEMQVAARIKALEKKPDILAQVKEQAQGLIEYCQLTIADITKELSNAGYPDSEINQLIYEIKMSIYQELLDQQS